MSENPKTILTHSNPKIIKAQPLAHGERWLPAIIHLTPHRRAGAGNVCPNATFGAHGCAAPCLDTSGHGGIGSLTTNKVQLARKRRTRFWFDHREDFVRMATTEIGAMVRKADRLPEFQGVAIRPNGTSDLRELAFSLIDSVNKEFPDAPVMFYDYTKIPWVFESGPWLRSNYHLTLSWSGMIDNAHDSLQALHHGCNVAAMHEATFSSPSLTHATITTPKGTARTFSTFDADSYDLRFLDCNRRHPSRNPEGEGRVGILKPKGKAKKSRFPGFAGKVLGQELILQPDPSAKLKG